MRTRVGYTGGSKANPTYRSLGDHTEAFQVDYDPTVISYETLLGIFWREHNPHAPAYSRQYMSALFYGNDEQERLALETRARIEAETGREVFTRIAPLEVFYLAEDYHQKYYLRARRDLARELVAIYPDPLDFVNSTAVARVNGYVGGHGTREQLQAEIGQLGLSDQAQAFLLEQIGPRLKEGEAACPVPTSILGE